MKKFLFKLIRALVKLFYPTTYPDGTNNLPTEACIVVGNHSQLHGPIVGELYYPRPSRTWCAGEMMELSRVPAYAYRDFWSNKPIMTRPFYKLLSYVIAPVSVCVFNSAKTIGVWHDSRIISTFRNTVNALEKGEDVIIFPEHDEDYNHILCEFQNKFVDTARMYYRKTGKDVSFVPMYLAPNLKKFCFGTPVSFRHDAPIEEERERICNHLKQEITRIAESLPEHKVVPYRNVSKKYHTSNRIKEILHEKAGG